MVKHERSLILAVYASFSYLYWVNVWVADDALISFTHLHHFFNGDGLVFNPGERVQAFTNTLWTFIYLPFYGVFIDEPSSRIFSLSMFISFLTMLAFIRLSQKLLTFRKWLLFNGALMLSKCFIDYSSSGLETPLSYVLLTLFCFYVLQFQKLKKPFFLGGVLSSLLILNRPDFGIFAVAIFAYCMPLVVNERNAKALLWYCLGLIPLFLWLFFSLSYYGSIVPNTALAKLNLTHVSLKEYLWQARWYVRATLVHDFWLFSVIGLGLILPLYTRLGRQPLLLYLSALVYALYVVVIGGDFMLGRFWLPSFIILAILFINNELYKKVNRYLIGAVAFVSIIILVKEKHFTYNFKPERKIFNGIADEKEYYLQNNGLLGVFITNSVEKRKAFINDNVEGQFSVVSTIGSNGYFRKENTYVVDRNALSDPLLARLPEIKKGYRPGHMRRKLPVGYLQSLKMDSNVIADPRIHRLYDDVRLATRSEELFTKKRWRAIWRLNNPFD